MINSIHSDTAPAVLVACIISVCSGCSSDSSSSGNTDENDNGFVINTQPAVGGSFNFLGYVDLIDDSFEDQMNHDSNFFAMRQATSTSDFTTIPPAVGQCRLRITNTIPTDATSIGFPTQPFDLASAGETMTFTSPTGTYATVSFSESRFDIGAYPAPDTLTLDLPGMDFPAFSNVTVPPLNLPTDFVASTGQSLTADTVFTWTPGSSADNTLYLRATSFPQGKALDLQCRFVDDGEFTLPGSVDQALVNAFGADYSIDGARLDRKAVNIVTDGDALLVVSRRRE